jgi:hypothetical protein
VAAAALTAGGHSIAPASFAAGMRAAMAVPVLS